MYINHSNVIFAICIILYLRLNNIIVNKLYNKMCQKFFKYKINDSKIVYCIFKYDQM